MCIRDRVSTQSTWGNRKMKKTYKKKHKIRVKLGQENKLEEIETATKELQEFQTYFPDLDSSVIKMIIYNYPTFEARMEALIVINQGIVKPQPPPKEEIPVEEYQDYASDEENKEDSTPTEEETPFEDMSPDEFEQFQREVEENAYHLMTTNLIQRYHKVPEEKILNLIVECEGDLSETEFHLLVKYGIAILDPLVEPKKEPEPPSEYEINFPQLCAVKPLPGQSIWDTRDKRNDCYDQLCREFPALLRDFIEEIMDVCKNDYFDCKRKLLEFCPSYHQEKLPSSRALPKRFSPIKGKGTKSGGGFLMKFGPERNAKEMWKRKEVYSKLASHFMHNADRAAAMNDYSLSNDFKRRAQEALQNAREERDLAVGNILQTINKDHNVLKEIDLHGLHRGEIDRVLEERFASVRRYLSTGKLKVEKDGFYHYLIIVGVGKHSKNQRSVLRPALREFFKTERDTLF
eukprot:TRINITY_DN10996_c0_g2_i1.p1 TRINITY_DN10996_c0_g2~~TRINITY_DN10996_c0_g2_i1.p1  ORF type:complete len:461 (+),score=91.44 TRINITY_DN10996_c0_g2_i1:159-1541(+)